MSNRVGFPTVIGAIFVEGYGKRLASSTSNTPKALLPLKDDYVILDKQLPDFKNAGIREAFLLTGYKGEKIERRYGASWKGLRLHYQRRARANGNPMGTH